MKKLGTTILALMLVMGCKTKTATDHQTEKKN
jgi:uncharacterized protein YcfL